MNINLEKIENYIKGQSEVFLLELGAFYPFGCAINKKEEVAPLGGYIEGDNPSILELIELLKNNITEKLDDGEYSVAAIAVNVMVKKGNVNIDAIEVSIFEKDKLCNKKYIEYEVKDRYVEFISN
ncbi:hypothetical protein ACQKCH_01365 [Nubsella zeaxanthinifaciens]|uniref:hypothetical protein n=1 Tax=Nubsella zeaxanthinifaciens TaxID=392412 RepID=UPI003D04CA88